MSAVEGCPLSGVPLYTFYLATLGATYNGHSSTRHLATHFDEKPVVHLPRGRRGRGKEGRATGAFAPWAPSVRGPPNGAELFQKDPFIIFIPV